MPRSILLTNSIALLCMSLLLGAGLTQSERGTAPVGGIAGTLLVAVALCTLVIMAITEWFTGIRWAPVTALAAVVVVCVVGWSSTLAHSVSVLAVCTGWAAVAYWFAALSFRSRENR